MFDSLRARILFALSLTCAASTAACRKSDDATSVESEGAKKPKPENKKEKPRAKKEWLVETKTGSCPHSTFCSTEPDIHSRSDASALSAECGSGAKVPPSLAVDGYAEKTASLHLDETEKARDDGEKTACCYVYRTGPCGKGRPLRHEGALVLASDVERDGWCDANALDLSSFAPAELAAFAEHLRRVALLEHGSVAAFARVSLELLSLGAPSDLIEAAHRAALDEISHARLCWSALAAVEGAPRGPSPMTIPPMPAVDPERILVATVVEGCIGETVGSLLFAEAARRCTVPALAKMYATIADEEADHAALAFRIVQFLVQDDPARAERALEAAARAEQEVGDGPAIPALGMLDSATQRDVLERACQEVVLPVLLRMRDVRALPTRPRSAAHDPRGDGGSSDTSRAPV